MEERRHFINGTWSLKTHKFVTLKKARESYSRCFFIESRVYRYHPGVRVNGKSASGVARYNGIFQLSSES